METIYFVRRPNMVGEYFTDLELATARAKDLVMKFGETVEVYEAKLYGLTSIVLEQVNGI